MNGVPTHPELLLRERAWLQALARHLVQSHDGAEELAQDTLAAALTTPAPRHPAGLRGWLAAILRHKLAGSRRTEFRRRAREAAAARPEALPTTLDTVASFEVQRDVSNAVLALPEPYRTTVLLRFWDEQPPAAIAARMAVPVETVRTRLKRGLAQLRERLDQKHGGERKAWAAPLGLLLQPSGTAVPPISVLAGISLMAALWKVAFAATAVIGSIWLFWASPWSPAVDAGPPGDPTERSPAAAVSAALQPTPPAPTIDGAPVDRVAAVTATNTAWLVLTGTVVDDATGAPLPGARVRIITWPARSSTDPEELTAADGTFTLREVQPPGPEVRQLLVQATDYAVARSHLSYDTKAPTPHHVDAGTIRLMRGTLFAGRVVDQEGRGVPDAELLLPLLAVSYGGYGGPQGLLERTASLGRTDADGSFQLEQPVAPDSNHQNLLFALAPRGVGWGTFAASKERREVPDLVIQLRPNGALRLLVEAPDGTPFAGAIVRALPRFGPVGIAIPGWHKTAPGPAMLRDWLVGTTDARGELRLPNLFLGERALNHAGRTERDYELWIEAPGHPTQPMPRVQLQAGTEQRLAVRLLAARKVTVAVDVRDDLGAPIEGATVAVVALGTRIAAGNTDGSGHVEIPIVATPNLTVAASAKGHREAQSQLEVKTDSMRLLAAVVLARTQPLDGTVVDQFGAPTPGMKVFVDQQLVATTDAQGRFHAEAFPMGERQVVVAVGADQDPMGWTGLQRPLRIDAARGPVTIVMERRPGSIDVRVAVVDATTGETLEPIEAQLRLFSHGSFIFQKRVETSHGLVTSKATPAGRWLLTVRTATGAQGSLEFSLTEGQPPVDLRLELPRPGTITGRVQFVGVAAPTTLSLNVRYENKVYEATRRHPGRWQVEPTNQSVENYLGAGTGQLRMQPVANSSFRLEAADSSDVLVFWVRADGLVGEAKVRVEPGQSREVVLEIRAKPK